MAVPGALFHPADLALPDSAESIALDIASIARISAVPSLLRVICQHTGMGFAAVARVTDGTWTACAVEDRIGFGLLPGGQLDLHSTLCKESRAVRQPILIDQASRHPIYRDHHTPRIYSIESYVSVPIVMQDGAYFGNLCAIDPRPALVSDNGTLAMFTAFAELIALQLQQVRLQQATEAQLLDARAAADLREQFVAVLGHDLRNPLNSVGVTAELLVRRAEPELAAMGRRLRATVRRMAGLIDDVMDFTRSRLGSGIGIVPAATEDLAEALHSVVAELRDSHPQRQLEVRLALAGRVVCDRGRLQQLLSNLLGNALMHGAADQPVLVEGWTEPGLLVLAVTNGGEPIPPEHAQKIFEPYWRPVHSTPGGGLGLGLHICAQIVKAHGGTLTVQSSRAQGTRFEARLPSGG